MHEPKLAVNTRYAKLQEDEDGCREEVTISTNEAR